jgi:nucleoid-associated protein YgaU
MGLLSFIKEAGEKLLHINESAPAAAAASPDADAGAANAIKTYITGQGIDTSKLDVSYDGASTTVTLAGSVPDQASKEKSVVSAGNVHGVSAVNHDGLNVDAPAPAANFHDVEPGDTLSAISKKVYGDANKYEQIFEANKPMLKSPDRIYPGQKLVIPPLS